MTAHRPRTTFLGIQVRPPADRLGLGGNFSLSLSVDGIDCDGAGIWAMTPFLCE